VTLQVALKEWAVVCRALAEGRQILLLRKGGIYESAGEFEIEHRKFLLLPTYLHQNKAMLKERKHTDFQPASAEPERINISAFAEITDIIPMKSRAAMDALDEQHVWTPPLIDMRFNYKPENPLYLLLVRANALRDPVMIENTPAYAGCKSWVPLETAISVADAKPVLDDAAYQMRRQKILAVIQGL